MLINTNQSPVAMTDININGTIFKLTLADWNNNTFCAMRLTNGSVDQYEAYVPREILSLFLSVCETPYTFVVGQNTIEFTYGSVHILFCRTTHPVEPTEPTAPPREPVKKSPQKSPKKDEEHPNYEERITKVEKLIESTNKDTQIGIQQSLIDQFDEFRNRFSKWEKISDAEEKETQRALQLSTAVHIEQLEKRLRLVDDELQRCRTMWNNLAFNNINLLFFVQEINPVTNTVDLGRPYAINAVCLYGPNVTCSRCINLYFCWSLDGEKYEEVKITIQAQEEKYVNMLKSKIVARYLRCGPFLHSVYFVGYMTALDTEFTKLLDQ